MKLGIAVAYLAGGDGGGLLRLHLDRIAAHTGVPYTIYAGANRLRPDLRGRLAERPDVRLCNLPATEARESAEHAFYLERLMAEAVGDGATHVAVLHLDSFPVRDGWARDLAGALSPSRPFAAAVRDAEVDRKPFTACLFAGADFVRRGPRLLLTAEERRSRPYRRYRREHPHHPDSGVGWGFLAFREDLDWLRLERSNAAEDHGHFGSIHGDLVFHLGAASWQRKDFPARREPTRWLSLRRALAAAGRAAAPAPLRAAVKRALARAVPAMDVERKYEANERAFAAVRDRLLADPDGYLRFLRSGS